MLLQTYNTIRRLCVYSDFFKVVTKMSDILFNTTPPRWYQITDNIQKINCIEKADVENVHPTRVIPEWVVVLITKGERTVRIGDENYEIRTKEFFLLPPGIPHSGIRLDRHKAYFSHFYAEGKEVAPPTRIVPDKILLPIYGQLPMDTHCIDVMDYAARHRIPPFFSEPLQKAQLVSVLYQLSINMQKNALWTKKDSVYADEILNFIDNNLDKRLCDEDYSSAFGKSYRQLNTIFSRVYGMTIKQMQLNLRIARAKSLFSSGYTIAYTSAACGFEDYFYFLKIFKARTGFTPTEYINKFFYGDTPTP